jgi:hypothetical protein
MYRENDLTLKITQLETRNHNLVLELEKQELDFKEKLERKKSKNAIRKTGRVIWTIICSSFFPCFCSVKLNEDRKIISSFLCSAIYLYLLSYIVFDSLEALDPEPFNPAYMGYIIGFLIHICSSVLILTGYLTGDC